MKVAVPLVKVTVRTTCQSLRPVVLNTVTVAAPAGSLSDRWGRKAPLALGMVVVMAITIVGYTLLQRRTTRWLKV